ncbi:MAG: hypothetical protein ACXABY_28070, partial [Candidatus Thorarchaeota archaeon]
THLSGFNAVLFKVAAAPDGPASTGNLTVTGLATGDTILNVAGAIYASAAANSITTVNLASTAYSISAAATVVLKGTTAYSGYAFDVLYLDADKA